MNTANKNTQTAPLCTNVLNGWLDTSKNLDLLTLASMLTGMPRTAPDSEVTGK